MSRQEGIIARRRRVLYSPVKYTDDGRYVLFESSDGKTVRAYEERAYWVEKNALVQIALEQGYPPAVVSNYAPLRRLKPAFTIPVSDVDPDVDFVKEHLDSVFSVNDDRRGAMG